MHGEVPSISRPTWQNRCLALFVYAGGLPLLALAPRWRKNPFVAHHYNHAAAIILLLLLVTSVSAIILLSLSYLLVFHREFYESVHLESRMLSLIRKTYLCWDVLWLFAAVLALLGSTRHVLLVSRLAERKRLVRIGAVFSVGVCVITLLILPVAAHASMLVRSDPAPGAAYFIYEDLGIFPRWIFALGFYRVALEAREQYGRGSAVLLPLSPESVARAKREGHFVVIGAHGRPRGMVHRSGWITPDDVRAMPGSNMLRFVYLSSCDSGAQRKAWEEAFLPAKVVTFDRLSAVAEHIWWLWFQAPAALRETAARPLPEVSR